MNERIKELAEQARQYAFAKVENTQDPTEWSSKYYNEMFDQKFAELIVQECADWIDGSPSTDAGQLLLTKSFIIANIKGHFGVEE